MYKNRITTTIIGEVEYQKLDDTEKMFYAKYSSSGNALIDDNSYLYDDEEPDDYQSFDSTPVDRTYGSGIFADFGNGCEC